MSYSRWSTSRWYVFHHCESGTLLDEQVLAIYDLKGQSRLYGYDEVKDAFEAKELDELCKPYALFPTDPELSQLMGYVQSWLQDVEEDEAIRVKQLSNP